jgi:hypothetical protein
MILNAPSANHQRHNRPTANEIAVILPGTDDTVDTSPRDIVIEFRHGRLKQIYETHSTYLPMHYPLLFSYGECKDALSGTRDQ